jgi:hypothetical protein
METAETGAGVKLHFTSIMGGSGNEVASCDMGTALTDSNWNSVFLGAKQVDRLRFCVAEHFAGARTSSPVLPG